MEEQRRLCVMQVGAHDAYVVGNVTICGKDIKTSIEIVVKEKAAEGERLRRRRSNARVHRLIGKQARAVTVVKRHAFVGEVANQQALTARSVVVSGICAHSRARAARIAESDTGGE